MVEIVKGDHEANIPESLAALLIKHRGWEISDGQEISEELAEKLAEPEADEPVPVPTFLRAPARAAAVEEQAVVAEEVAAPVIIEAVDVPAAGEINNNATCDEELPDGVEFAASAYTTVVDPETGNKIKVLKTHCVNKHEYAGANVKIRVRDGKAYRECQTCLKARRARANEKEKAERAAVKAPAKKAAAKQ